MDCSLNSWFDFPQLWEPDASWLFMADAPLLRPLSSAHTWLLWDEVTSPVLARSSQTFWKQCCVTSPHHIKPKDPEPGLQEWTWRLRQWQPPTPKTTGLSPSSSSWSPSPFSRSTPSPSLSLLSFFCAWLVPGWFIWGVGKAPGYICQLLSLDLLHAGWLWNPLLALPTSHLYLLLPLHHLGPQLGLRRTFCVGVFQGLSSEEYYWCSHVVVSTTLSLSNLLSCSLLCYENRHVQLHTQTASSSHHLLDLSQNRNRLTN